MVNFAPGDEFEGTLDQVEQLVAVGNLADNQELRNFRPKYPQNASFQPPEPLDQIKRAEQSPIMNQTLEQEQADQVNQSQTGQVGKKRQ